MYQIKVEFQTGDSFHYEDVEKIFGPDIEGPYIDTNKTSWLKLDVVKENLLRIKSHYEWHSKYNSSYEKSESGLTYKEWDALKEKDRPIFAEKKYNSYLLLLKDDLSEFSISASWCGFFETLYGAEIVKKTKDTEMFFKYR